MLIIIHSETNQHTISRNLGRSEYSYYFVLKEYRPVLERLGRVIEVMDPNSEVDALYAECQSRGEACVFLSFSPPHRTPVHLACPTLPVFAWEFSTIPDEPFAGDPLNDWRTVLAACGAAITHSSYTVDAVRKAMSVEYPIVAVPAPVWDRFAARGVQLQGQPAVDSVRLKIKGLVVDSREIALDAFAPVPLRRGRGIDFLAPVTEQELVLEGVVYTSVFNPDGRKNWEDMISAFCAAMRENADAALVLKLTHHDAEEALTDILHHLYKNQPYRCRIVLIYGYLADADYERLVQATRYVVNTSYGEGQCLPLMEFMSCGKPAVAPCTTAMIDYMNADNAFLIEATEHHGLASRPAFGLSNLALRNELGFDLCRLHCQLRRRENDLQRYATMSAQAVVSLEAFCSQAVAEQRLRAFLASLLQARAEMATEVIGA